MFKEKGRFGVIIYFFRVNVRLGEYNTDTNPDCIFQSGFEECNDPHLNVPVEETYPHAEYDPVGRGNDIALVRLTRDVRFSGEILQ